jgi:prephenate dehydrogenase
MKSSSPIDQSCIGMVGFGRFGQLAASHLVRGRKMSVKAYDPRASARHAMARLGVLRGSLQDVARSKVVILSVPISRMESVLKRIAPLLSPGTLVLDTCSVKVYPVQLMRRILPRSVQILGTHPLFGPDSAANGIRGHRIVLCPVRVNPAARAQIRRFLSSQGLLVFESGAREHDAQMAYTLVLTHFIGRGLLATRARQGRFDTPGYRKFLEVMETVRHDTGQLFRDMNRYNPYAQAMRARLLRSLRKIDGSLKS